MAVEIHPIQIMGNWDLGFSLDVHVVKSILIGEDDYGHRQFSTTRSAIGELLYQFKYKQRYDYLSEIVDTIISFLNTHPDMRNINTILPVPPTKNRDYQPTFEIAEGLATELNIFCCFDVLENVSKVEAKGLSFDEKKKLNGSIIKKKMATRKHNTLLIDDLYDTGVTLFQCVNALRQDPLIDKIYVLTVTKTKNQ